MRVLCIAASVLLFGLTGCQSTAPRAFTKALEPGWSAIEIREDMGYDDAWRTVFALLARSFDIELAMKDEGYLQTQWLHSWGGTYDPAYTVRITVMFASDKKSLSVKSEALLGEGAARQTGVDTRLASTIKTDLMGVVGRTTR